MKNLTMGEMRLLFIHIRVQYLCLNYLDEENMDEFKYKPLCDYCEMKLDMSGGKRGNELEVAPRCKTLFVPCSGVGWLCRARQRLINATHIHWESEGQMTTKKIYKMILMHILKNQQPKDALYNIEHFNLELTKKMPHLIKTTQLAEFLIYSNYIPFQLTEEIFPVPPIGEEFTDAYVPPMKSKMKYENKNNELVETEEYGWIQPGWKEELTKNYKNLAENPSPEQDFIEQILDQIKKYETLDAILHAIHKLSLATDACFHCVWLKHKVPGKIINCTGIPKLCSLKYELFNAWPSKFYKESYLMTRILLCDTMKNYGKLLDEIFNVKFIERAMQLKAMVDCQIMAIHPHMAKIITYYGLLIYRYYSPVWNRNGEGKLQTLEKKEKEEDEEEEEDDNNNNNNDDKKELNTGGLEKGEGVQVVVLKVVPKKKKREKDEEEKEKDEKENEKEEE